LSSIGVHASCGGGTICELLVSNHETLDGQSE
jgi:hypothetical protein